MPRRKKLKRGFALLPKAERRRIGSKGGTMAHRNGNGRQWTVKEARTITIEREEKRKNLEALGYEVKVVK